MDRRFFLDNLWRWKCGLPEVEVNKKKVDIDKAYERFDKEFITYMPNRIGMGYFRYESTGKKHDYLKGIELKLKRYQETKNKEFLVDAANYCMLEFIDPGMEGTYFKATDDDKQSRLKPL